VRGHGVEGPEGGRRDRKAESAAPATAKKATSAMRGVLSRMPNPPNCRVRVSWATIGSYMAAGGGCSTRARAARSTCRSTATTCGRAATTG
jgi:hypothetical protein